MRGKEEEEVGSSCAWDCGSPLYDSYELASLAHQLERHTMASPFVSCDRKGSPNRLNQGRTMNMEAGLHDHQAGRITKFARSSGMWKKARKYLTSGFCSFCNSVGLFKNKGQYVEAQGSN
ncbi:hypothetical protein FNV43_RR09389 [Rhamnella rubrinervis]|uniref:Uncharacterized protein n=1 Tax=Rhamnella rubrinervis TaxID=2594499 RepID=A0A8K0HAD0_9ROSA|nr:hypothetical protein FNV43_RR09389 [Rhamnella rubrinervis]